MLSEQNYGKGAIKQEPDNKDLAFASVAPFDWELGFDIELLLGYRAQCSSEAQFWGSGGRQAWGVSRYREIVKECQELAIRGLQLNVKDQGASYSCTGQSLGYYLEVCNFIETGQMIEISARDIYAYISLGFGQGAYLRDALKLACNRGVSTDDLVPSYYREGGTKKPYTETEYLQKPVETATIVAMRKMLQSKDYRLLSGAVTMDAIAWQMLEGFGSYFAVNGQDNSTWFSEYPQPPKSIQWGHALFGGKAGLDSDKKPFIGHINSWGNKVGVNGWQKLKNNYFESYNVLSPWTLIDKSNMTRNNNIKIIKDKNSSAVGIWLPALSQEALKSYCLNFGIEVPTKQDGAIDWESWIDGELTLK